MIAIPRTVQGFDLPSDPTPTLPTFPLRPSRYASGPSSPASPNPRPVGPVPRVRFSAWSGRYVATLAAADVVIGALAAAVPTLFSNSLGTS